MAQANRLPSAMRALITGANRKSSTAQTLAGEHDLRWTNAAPSLIAASCRLAWRRA
jgi:hypothetical protein